MRESATQIARSKGVWLLAAATAAGLTFAALPHGVATPVEFSGLTRTATINASRNAVWYGQMNAKGICDLFPSCTSATKTRTGYRLTIAGNVPGLGSVTQNVDATVVKKARPRLVRLKLAADSTLGTVNATVSITLKPKAAQKTTVKVHVNKARGTGAMGTVMLPFLAQGLHTGLNTAAATLNAERKSSGIAVNAKRTNKKIRVTVLLKDPRVQPTPTATGKVRILTSKNKLVCKAKVKKSRATCTPRTKRKNLQAVVTGTYTSGFQVWHSAKVRVTK